MSIARIIWKRECKAALRSPVAWCVFAGFTSLVSLLFVAALRAGDNTFEHLPAMFCIQVYLCLCIPVSLFTMRLFSEEKTNGTIEMLMTAPVRDVDVVMGKFFSAYTLVALSIGASFIAFPLYTNLANPPPAFSQDSLYGGIISVLLVAAMWCAIGTFISLLSRHQSVSAAATLVIVLSSAVAFTGNVPGFEFIGIFETIDFADVARGTLDSRMLCGVVSILIFFLFCSVRLLESRRWCNAMHR
ncbi:MAG: ABC transporter permease subunit [Kiritimatiellae bacterium]|jgi:ABC-2 type transport system permease protein|nr:ABC transporter permease subunit [Kiritimatiellia bacterium]